MDFITLFLSVDRGVMLATSTPMTMETLLSTISTIFTSIISWVGSTIQMITDNPLILLSVILGVALIAIGVVKRLLRL